MATRTQRVVDISPKESAVQLFHPTKDPEWSHTTVNYFKDADQPPPDSINSGLTEHELRLARRSDESPHIAPTPVRIQNIRGKVNGYSIEEHGFTIGYLLSNMCNWRDDDELKRTYFPEVTELLKRTVGAKHVYQYEWHVRTGTLEEALNTDSKGSVDINGPVRRVHIDESPKSAINEYSYYVRPNDPGNEHLKERPFGIFNVWKPLKPVRRDPLCLCMFCSHEASLFSSSNGFRRCSDYSGRRFTSWKSHSTQRG